ncbi:PKD domain-containing protein, partial [Bowmanella denitrificans]|uniref:PKD domain-containing protein n=1 Tax=Bowmanella denitrificans TaxID=366582 RepID=UPI0031D8768C
YTAQFYNLEAKQSGTYTLVVEDGTGNSNATGNYQIHLVTSLTQSEFGFLDLSGSYAQDTTWGDLDSYRFAANQGDEIYLTVTDINTTGLYPYITLYYPDGRFFTHSGGYDVAGWTALTIPESGNYLFIVEDGTGNSNQIAPYVINYNFPQVAPDPEKPIAIASAPTRVHKIQTINLDGSGSFDPDESPEPLHYQWQLLSAPTGSNVSQVNVDSNNPALADVVSDISGEYRFRLTVDDGLLSDSADALVLVVNRAPVAEAGENRQVGENTHIALDGSASSDADGDLLSYQWRIISLPQNSQAMLSDAQSVTPNLTTDIPGIYILGLIVNDGEDSSLEDQLSIEVLADNIAPVARASYSGDLLVGTAVTLDGSASSDADNGPAALSFQWQFIALPTGSGLKQGDIQSAQSPLASFSPDLAGNYQLQLSVFDGELTDTTLLTMAVADVPVCQLNANAGVDLAVETGNQVQLDGSASLISSACINTEIAWQFVSVPQGSQLSSNDIVNSGELQAGFMPDNAGVYVVSLSLTDGAVSAADSLMVTVTANAIPVADAGSDQQIEQGQTAMLDGSLSYDPDNSPAALSFQWTVLSTPTGSSATIHSPNTATSEFSADLAGIYRLQLSVSDGQDSASDTLTIEVQEPIQQPQLCDIDGDLFIDSRDIRAIMARRNTPASGEDDRADWNADGQINILDARGCVLQCSLPGCASASNN